MRCFLFPLLLLAACARPTVPAPPAAALPAPTRLPNGWQLTPAGRQIPLGDLPLNLVLSPNGQRAAVTNNGYGPNVIQLLDAATGQILDQQTVPAAWVGLAFDNQGHLYASGGQSNRVHVFQTNNDKLRPDSALVLGRPWPAQKIGVAGLAYDAQRQRLYAVTREDSALYTLDARTRATLRRTKLPAEAYAVLLAPDGRTLYVSLWGGHAVGIFDPETQQLTAQIEVESHPNDMVLTRDGRRLFVANANSNSVSVIDTRTRRVSETLSAALFPRAPAGSTSNGVALSKDEKTLFIANADNNCLAVFDVARAGASRSRGFIPTGWYPTAVRVAGSNLLITNGKGLASLPNDKDGGPRPDKANGSNTDQYIAGLLGSTLSVLPLPTEVQLAAFSTQVYANTPYTKARETQPDVPAGNPVPRRVGAASPIKHVFYIIKENRTYDQVLGDMPEGNGDKRLCLFGEDVTPNQHALAREFVLLDNFYVDAEVSADGHNWSMAAYANDYVEKTWPSNYSGRGGNYDYEGGRGEVAEPKDGFLWDYCQRAGVSFRSYGEFVYKGKPMVKALVGHFAPDYVGYDLDVRDVDREKVWEQDFDRLLAAGQVPALSILRLPSDHTAGAKIGMRTPQAFAADNDLAVGRLVEHLSKSSIWSESVVMIVEDDAQNGPDHVDAHRSTAYLIGPHVRRHAVVHDLYSTSGMLRTLELLLGLPPMSQYDAAAAPLWRCFTPGPNPAPYVALPARLNLDAQNTAFNQPARDAQRFNLSREDAAPDLEFNRNIWQAVRGEHSLMPAPRRSAFVKTAVRKKDDDD